jgi:signal transduction histidine kinase
VNNIKALSLYIFFFSSLIAAQSHLDSELTKFNGQPDTIKIKFLCDLSWQNRYNSPKTAIEAGELALATARKISNKKFEAKALNLIGVVYRGRGDYDKSLTYFMSARDVAEEVKDSVEIAYAENNIGSNYRLKSYFSLALEHVLNGLKIFENLKNKTGEAFCTINIGYIYRRQNNFIKALEYFELTYKTRNALGDESGTAIALSAIADLYSDHGDLDKALEFYDKAEKCYSESGEKSGLVNVWSGIGDIYFRRNNYNQALKFHTNALNLAKQITRNEGHVLSEKNIGLIYAHARRFAEGEKYITHALWLARKIKDNYLVLSCYRAFSKFYELKNDLPSSLKYLKMYTELKDTTTLQENIAGIGELEAIYKNEKTQKMNAILLKDNEMAEKQKNFLMILIAILILSSATIYARYVIKQRTNKRLNEINATKDKFFGIIAHDLKNPFNSIFGATEILLENFNNQTDVQKLHIIKEIENSARQTYKLLENLLYWSRTEAGIIRFNPKILSINDIIKETNLLLENTANNKNIKLTEKISGQIEAFCDEEMLKTVLRNLISNGIKFTNTGGRVNTIAQKTGSNIEISVVDSGIGMSTEIQSTLFKIDKVSTSRGTNGEKGTGLGLILCKEFVEKNNGKIWVESKSGEGSRFIFTVPAANK